MHVPLIPPGVWTQRQNRLFFPLSLCTGRSGSAKLLIKRHPEMTRDLGAPSPPLPPSREGRGGAVGRVRPLLTVTGVTGLMEVRAACTTRISRPRTFVSGCRSGR